MGSWAGADTAGLETGSFGYFDGAIMTGRAKAKQIINELEIEVPRVLVAAQTEALPFLSPEQQSEALGSQPSPAQPAADDALASLKPPSMLAIFLVLLVGFGLVGWSHFCGADSSSRRTPLLETE